MKWGGKMSVVVGKLFDIFLRSEIKLVAGEGGLDNMVEWFHVMVDEKEAPFINEGELIVTSASFFEDTTAFFAFVQAMHDKETCGMLIPLGRGLAQLPTEVVDYCNAHAYPLIVASRKCDMSRLMKVFSMQILSAEKASHQLFPAMKNAISFPKKTELYMPTFFEYGFQNKDSYTVIIIKVEEFQAMTTTERKRLIKFMEQTLLVAGDKSFELTMDDVFVLVFSDYSGTRIKEITSKIIERLRKRGYTFYAGMSENLPGLYALSSAYLQTEQIISMSEQLEWKNILVHYRDLGALRLLLSVADKKAKRTFYNSVLGRLETYDKNNGTTYLAFLETYMNNNCSISATADKMFVHRNTIVYKLNKIEELLDRDLSQIDVRAELYLACMLRKIT